MQLGWAVAGVELQVIKHLSYLSDFVDIITPCASKRRAP